MATYPPPANEQGSIFNPDTWIQQPLNSVDTAFLDANYCRFPVAQGNMNFSSTNTAGNSDFGSNIVLNGTYLTNYIQFPDGSQQFAASAGGTGDALLDGGTSSVPQNFTGYNEFSNADGRITLTNTTNSNTINLECSQTVKQLDIYGQMSIGNNANTNTVIINSDGTTPNQLDVQGGLQIVGGGFPMLMSAYSNSTSGVYGLQVSGGGLRLGSNGGSVSSSTYVQLACLDAGDNQLSVAGSIQLSNSTLTGNAVTISSGTTGLVISSGIEVGGNCVLVNTVSSIQSTSTLSQSASVAQTVVCNGNLQLFGGTTNRTISLNYVGQDDIEIYQNYTGNLECNSGITISPNIEGYPSNTNRITLYADETTDNQLNVQGNLLTTGNIILGSGSTPSASITFGNGSVQTVAYTGQVPSGAASLSAGSTSSSPQTFTGYNQINLLQYNGMSCPLKAISGFVSYQTGLGSEWIWTTNIPTTLGNGFAFAFSTNNTATPYAATTNDVLVPQANGIISGTGYALYQPYTYLGVDYPAYIWSITGYSGTASLTAKTIVNNQGTGYPYYQIQTNDNNSYYAVNNIKMTLYIYPQAIV